MFLVVHLFISFKNNSMTTQKQIECCNHKKLLLFMSKQQNFYSAFMILILIPKFIYSFVCRRLNKKFLLFVNICNTNNKKKIKWILTEIYDENKNEILKFKRTHKGKKKIHKNYFLWIDKNVILLKKV